MKIILFWEDKNWQYKGAADNVWLNIYPDSMTYKRTVTPFCDIHYPYIAEVKRKRDIDEMVMYLKNNGYVEEV